METFLIWGALFVGLAVVFALVLASTQPTEFRIQRAKCVAVSKEDAFAVIVDLARWPEWSPWERMDPMMHRAVSEPSAGVGAIYEWNGNKQVGQGRMQIVEANYPNKIVMALEFQRPWKAKNGVEFLFERVGGLTRVDWAMTGRHNFVGKLFSLAMNMDAMVGKDFERGLENLARLLETPR